MARHLAIGATRTRRDGTIVWRESEDTYRLMRPGSATQIAISGSGRLWELTEYVDGIATRFAVATSLQDSIDEGSRVLRLFGPVLVWRLLER